MKATYQGHVLAQSDATITLEGNHYFPRESVNMKMLSISQTQYTCPWKGDATYWNTDIDGQVIQDIAWSYDQPLAAASKIKEHIAFDQAKIKVSQ